MPTDEDLAEYAAILAERLNLLPGCPNGHSWDTIDDVRRRGNHLVCRRCENESKAESRERKREERRLARARAAADAAGMRGVLRCMECGNHIRDHEHTWCDIPRRKGWVPGDEMRKREGRIRGRYYRERAKNRESSSK